MTVLQLLINRFMKHTLALTITALLSCLGAFAQPKEIKVSVDGVDIELVRIEPGTVTLPKRVALTKEYDPSTGGYSDYIKDPVTGQKRYVGDAITLPETDKVISEPYYIMKYPVTRAQWGRIFLGEEKYMQTGKKATMPITLSYSDDKGVDRNLEQKVLPFINKIRAKTGLGWELPSYGEWLLACGPIPEDFENYAWIDGSVHDVGLKKPNDNGAYDMLGMVGEMIALEEPYVQDGKLVEECPQYVGGVPQLGAKSIRKDPSKLLDWMRRAPTTSMVPPTFRLILKGVPEDCPGILKTQIVKDGDKCGLETEYGTVLKPEYDVVKMAEVDSELAAGGGFLASKNGKWGVFTRKGEALLPMNFEDEKTALANIPFLEYISYSYNYRQEAKRLSATKEEFEKTADFEARKADPVLQKSYVEAQMKDFEQHFINIITKDERTKIALLDYDADKEAYRFKVNNARTLWTVYELPVPIDAAPAFKEYMGTAPQQELLKSAKWGIVDDCAQILNITFTLPDGRSFTYTNPAGK